MKNVEENLVQDIIRWKEQEGKYSKLFSPVVLTSKAFKTERLKQLLIIEAKYNKNDLQDPSVYALLKAEKGQLEKQLSSGFISLLIQRVMDAFRLQRFKRRHEQQLVKDFSEIRETLQQIGFGKYGERAEKILSNSNGPQSISYTEQFAPKQIVEYTLNFSKKDGLNRFDNYKVTFLDENNKEQRQQVFKDDGLGIISAENAAKLLSGLAIKDGPTEWLQMDFNDKDKQGNYRVIRFGHEKLDDGIRDALSRLPIKKLSIEAREKILNELAHGNTVKINLASNPNEIQATIRANPRQFGIIVLDNDGKVLDPNNIPGKEQVKSRTMNPADEVVKPQRSRLKVVR